DWNGKGDYNDAQECGDRDRTQENTGDYFATNSRQTPVRPLRISVTGSLATLATQDGVPDQEHQVVQEVDDSCGYGSVRAEQRDSHRDTEIAHVSIGRAQRQRGCQRPVLGCEPVCRVVDDCGECAWQDQRE